jgi:hypothetical protein
MTVTVTLLARLVDMLLLSRCELPASVSVGAVDWTAAVLKRSDVWPSEVPVKGEDKPEENGWLMVSASRVVVAELVAESAVRPDRVVTVSEFGQYAPSLNSQHPLGYQVFIVLGRRTLVCNKTAVEGVVVV